jgi:hypothetical protein
MKPSYELKQLENACKQGHAEVHIMRPAKKTARADFDLTTKQDIVRFIGDGGLVNPRFINTKKWEKNPNSDKSVMVDSYAFYSGYLYGYIAFMFTGGKWTIKSFKKNKESDARYFPFKDSLKGIIH